MIRLTDNLWIGDSVSPKNIGAVEIGAVLNVAQDLQGEVGWPDVEYAQVGLVDGPGNLPAAYHAAVLALATLRQRYNKVLVYDHDGGRALAVVVIYLNQIARHGWNGWMEVIRKLVDIDLPVPHPAHRAAFDRINWRMLGSVAQW